MVLTNEQKESFEKAARPLIEWLCKNCHPHVTVIVEPGSAELKEGVSRIVVEDYIPD